MPQAKVARGGWVLGDFLFILDQRELKRKDEAFTAAFPVSTGNGATSQMRFANQFVGSLKQGRLTGLPAALQFIACDNAKESRLHLTRAGADFAALTNPIFDVDRERATRKFYDEEIQFLLMHIQRSVPQEASAYTAIAEGIQAGQNTPNNLDRYLLEKFHLREVPRAESPNEITRAFLTTQRTGAISRMADLGLLGRQKEGVRVTYLVTKTGTQFRAKLNS